MDWMPVWKGDFFWSILKSDKPLSPLSPLSSLSLSLSLSPFTHVISRDFRDQFYGAQTPLGSRASSCGAGRAGRVRFHVASVASAETPKFRKVEAWMFG